MAHHLRLDGQQVARRNKVAQLHVRDRARNPPDAGANGHARGERGDELEVHIHEQGAGKHGAFWKMVAEESSVRRNLQLRTCVCRRAIFDHQIVERKCGHARERARHRAFAAQQRETRAEQLGIVKFTNRHHRPHAVMQPQHRLAVHRRAAAVGHVAGVRVFEFSGKFERVAGAHFAQQFDAAREPRDRAVRKINRRHRRPRRELPGRLRHKRKRKPRVRHRKLRKRRRNRIAPGNPHARLDRSDAINERECAEVVVHE